MVRRICLVVLIIALAVNSAACGSKKLTRYEAEFIMLFDTMTRIVSYTESKKEFSENVQLVYDNLKEYHELYDIYHNYEGINNIKTINDNAGIAPVKVDQRIIDLIRFSQEWYTKTDGKVNIAYGAVLKIWHDYRTAGTDDPENAELPPLDKLEAAARHTDINKVIIDEAASTVFLEDPEMSLDVGAIAKGYATEQVSRMMMERGFTSGLISVGGNVRSIGSKRDTGLPWNLGIQNPDTASNEKELFIVNLTDSSLVTSGNYERFYTVDGMNYHHIIDPGTRFPSTYFTAVTIICKDSGIADALSTAVFNMPFEQGYEFIEKLPEAEALWVFGNGEIEYSSHFRDYIKK